MKGKKQPAKILLIEFITYHASLVTDFGAIIFSELPYWSELNQARREEQKNMTLPKYTGEIPYLTTEQMIEVDRAMMDDYKIELIQMMENAGRNLAHLAREVKKW